MRELSDTVALYIGGTGGVGFEMALETARRGAYTMLTSRRQESATRTAKQIQASLKLDGLDSQVRGLAYSPGDEPVSNVISELQKEITRLSPKRLIVGYVPGVTDLEFLDRNTAFPFTHYPDRDETRQLVANSGPNALGELEMTNVGRHKELFDAVIKLGIPTKYWFMSSGAANPEFYPKGNWVYGENKKEGEDHLRGAPDHVQVYATRVGFFISDTGGGLYPRIIEIESHKPESERDFWNADEGRFLELEEFAHDPVAVARAFQGLILDGTHPNMKHVDGPVYEYDTE